MLALHVRPPLPNKAGKACMRDFRDPEARAKAGYFFDIPLSDLLFLSCSPSSSAATCLSPPSADDAHKVHVVHTYVGQLGLHQPPRPPVDGPLCRMTGTKSLPRASLDAVPGWRR